MTKIIKRGGFDVEVGDDGVARVRDVDIGAKFGLSRPRDIRKTITELCESREITGVIIRDERARMKTKGGATR